MTKQIKITSDKEIINQLEQLTQEERDRLKHLLWVVDMEANFCPKMRKDYYKEFTTIYLDDELMEGFAINLIVGDIGELNMHDDEGSFERKVYLKQFLKDKFGYNYGDFNVE